MNISNYKVLQINREECIPWLKYKHYAHRVPSISYAFGLYNVENVLKGVCTFGSPPSHALCIGVCGVEYQEYVLELNRLCIEDNIKNAASYFVSRCLKLLPEPKIIVSYADTSKNHHGYIYQATNFIYTGLSVKFKDPKIKGLEHQHHGTYAHGMTNKQLKEKFGDNLYFVNRPRKHRYVYFVGCPRLIKELKYKILPYPKGETKRYDSGDSL